MTDIFDPTKTATEIVDPVSELVGEGKKFKTVDDLARGKIEADAYIERLKSENAAALAEARKSALADEQLESLRNEIKALREARVVPSKDNTSPALTLESVKSLVSETLTQAERNRTASQNIGAANEALIKQHGSLEKGAEAVKARALEVGMTVEALRNIAATSPSAFLKIMGGEQEPVNVDPLSPSRVPAERLPNLDSTPKEGTKAHFDAILKKSRSQYFTPAVQNAIWKAIKAGTYDNNA